MPNKDTHYDDRCQIWPDYNSRGGYVESEKVNVIGCSPRAGGGYKITPEAIRLLEHHEITDEIRARLTTILVDQRERTSSWPTVTTGMIDRARLNQPMVVDQRAERLLKFISRQVETIAETISITKESYEAYAWSESTEWYEITYLLEYLGEMGWVKRYSTPMKHGIQYIHGWQLTVSGHGKIAEQRVSVDSSQALVAMWFDESMAEAFEEGIEPAIREAGFEPLRIDRKEHINKIEDEIIAEIRRSRFVVADFTHGKKGARGGVYYEAGFAHGLNLPVIFTCREDKMNTLHFDTAHYVHISWKDPEDLRGQLRTRILAVIGEGPEI